MRLVDIRKVFFAMFLSGVIVGILYVNLVAAELMSMISVFQGNYLSEYLKVEELGMGYFLYLLKIRIFPFMILVLFVRTKIRRGVVFAFCAWTGFLWGVYMSLSVTNLGIKGVLFCLVSLFPHMILYMMAYLILLIYIYNYPESMWNAYKLLVLIFLIGMGLVLECMVNPTLLKWMIEML